MSQLGLIPARSVSEADCRSRTPVRTCSVPEPPARTSAMPPARVPTARATWTVQDMTLRAMVIPTYAIVLAIVTSVMTCLLGLLFLLIKEERPTGWVQVTVHGPDFTHTTQVPVSRQEMVMDVYSRVDYARSLSAAAQA